jgi:hypothetical protein
MEEKHNHNHAQGNGFMLGLIVGAGVTLLFTTKKGRQLFNYMTEKGLDSFAQLQATMDAQRIETDDEESDYIAVTERPAAPEPEKEAPKVTAHKKHPVEEEDNGKDEPVHVKQYTEDEPEKSEPKKPSRSFFRRKK